LPPEVRLAEQGDAPAIVRIHAQAIEERIATFRTKRWTTAEVEDWVVAQERFPLLVHEGIGGVDGWVRVLPYSDADFYAGVGEYALYVDRGARRRGLGRALLYDACEQARGSGYWKLVGKLFTTNEPSIELAHACGFRDVGVHLRHGRLDGEWRDVLVVERSLGAT
jgi:phosphinothricin acetyltransferase